MRTRPLETTEKFPRLRYFTISGIPENVSLHMVLDTVRGGAVVEAKLLDTLKIRGISSQT